MQIDLTEKAVDDLDSIIAREFDPSDITPEVYECFALFFIALGVANVQLCLDKYPALTLTHLMDRYFLGGQVLQ